MSSEPFFPISSPSSFGNARNKRLVAGTAALLLAVAAAWQFALLRSAEQNIRRLEEETKIETTRAEEAFCTLRNLRNEMAYASLDPGRAELSSLSVEKNNLDVALEQLRERARREREETRLQEERLQQEIASLQRKTNRKQPTEQ